MRAPIAEVSGLVKEYRVGGVRVAALDGVDLSLAPGEIVAVVGESGSGKTTLGSLILGIEQPSGGTILLGGEALPLKRPRALRRRLQLVPQNPLSALNPKRSIFDSVALPLAVHGLGSRSGRRERVAELLGLVGLPADVMDRHPAILSGGQRQRVAIARAIAAEPDMLVLDEPTSALDVSVQARVLELLVVLQRRLALTYLFISHDLGVVRLLAHRVVVLFRGRVVEEGPTASVFARPRHRYTQLLLASVPVTSPEEERLKPEWPWDQDIAAAEGAVDQGCRFRARCPYRIDLCAQGEPALREMAPEHLARCVNPG
jgi:peptide/nickel transport system ATP-binding protein/oligopeptide transport system ATP-binding protein